MSGTLDIIIVQEDLLNRLLLNNRLLSSQAVHRCLT
jgi:hypothetical protein